MKKFILAIALGFIVYLPQTASAQAVKPIQCVYPRQLQCTAYQVTTSRVAPHFRQKCIQYQCLLPSPYLRIFDN